LGENLAGLNLARSREQQIAVAVGAEFAHELDRAQTEWDSLVAAERLHPALRDSPNGGGQVELVETG
jgi:hypothetical protein